MIGWLLNLADRLRDAARRRRGDPDQARGRRAEDLAHRYLERHGFRIVAQNYRTPNGSGEIDLIGWDGPTLVIVEVKSRRDDEHAAPDRAIDTEKMTRLRRAALQFTKRADIPWEKVRFDTVSVLFEPSPRISHVKDAFSVRGPVS